MIRIVKRNRIKRKLDTLENLCLDVLAALLELNDEEHDNSFNVIQALSNSLCCALFNRLTSFNRSTLRHLCSSSFLQYLDLSNSRVTNESLKHVGEINTLRKLDLCKCYHITDDGVQHLSELKNLIHLNISKTRIKSDGLRQLARWFPALEVADLSFIEFTEDDFGTWGVRSSLHKLDLSYTKMTTRGLLALTTRLKLDLRAGVHKGGLINLRELSLCGNEQLAMDDALTLLPKLEKLDLFQSGVIQTGFQELLDLFREQEDVLSVKKHLGLIEITRTHPKWIESVVFNENWAQEKLRRFLELADDREIESARVNQEPSWSVPRSRGESYGDRIGDSEYDNTDGTFTHAATLPPMQICHHRTVWEGSQSKLSKQSLRVLNSNHKPKLEVNGHRTDQEALVDEFAGYEATVSNMQKRNFEDFSKSTALLGNSPLLRVAGSGFDDMPVNTSGPSKTRFKRIKNDPTVSQVPDLITASTTTPRLPTNQTFNSTPDLATARSDPHIKTTPTSKSSKGTQKRNLLQFFKVNGPT